MPEIGERRKAKEIGYKNAGYYIWAALEVILGCRDNL